MFRSKEFIELQNQRPTLDVPNGITKAAEFIEDNQAAIRGAALSVSAKNNTIISDFFVEEGSTINFGISDFSKLLPCMDIPAALIVRNPNFYYGRFCISHKNDVFLKKTANTNTTYNPVFATSGDYILWRADFTNMAGASDPPTQPRLDIHDLIYLVMAYYKYDSNLASASDYDISLFNLAISKVMNTIGPLMTSLTDNEKAKGICHGSSHWFSIMHSLFNVTGSASSVTYGSVGELAHLKTITAPVIIINNNERKVALHRAPGETRNVTLQYKLRTSFQGNTPWSTDWITASEDANIIPAGQESDYFDAGYSFKGQCIARVLYNGLSSDIVSKPAGFEGVTNGDAIQVKVSPDAAEYTDVIVHPTSGTSTELYGRILG